MRAGPRFDPSLLFALRCKIDIKSVVVQNQPKTVGFDGWGKELMLGCAASSTANSRLDFLTPTSLYSLPYSFPIVLTCGKCFPSETLKVKSMQPCRCAWN